MIIAKIAEKEEDMNVEAILKEMRSTRDFPDIGGIAVFLGVVKGEVEDGGKVNQLEYDCIRAAAEDALRKIAEEQKEKWNLRSIVLIHRIGILNPGEPTLFVAVAGRSRKELFPALEETVERIKREVPIFKLEKRDDGEYWIIGEKKVRRLLGDDRDNRGE
ncbi:MAG: molybdenum cofactor biosynthesis protein MoaE [Fervidicoccaceae archaeon]